MTRQDPNKYPEWMTGGSGNLATPRRQLWRAKVGGEVLLKMGDPELRPG